MPSLQILNASWNIMCKVAHSGNTMANKVINFSTLSTLVQTHCFMLGGVVLCGIGTTASIKRRQNLKNKITHIEEEKSGIEEKLKLLTGIEISINENSSPKALGKLSIDKSQDPAFKEIQNSITKIKEKEESIYKNHAAIIEVNENLTNAPLKEVVETSKILVESHKESLNKLTKNAKNFITTPAKHSTKKFNKSFDEANSLLSKEKNRLSNLRKDKQNLFDKQNQFNNEKQKIIDQFAEVIKKLNGIKLKNNDLAKIIEEIENQKKQAENKSCVDLQIPIKNLNIQLNKARATLTKNHKNANLLELNCKTENLAQFNKSCKALKLFILTTAPKYNSKKTQNETFMDRAIRFEQDLEQEIDAMSASLEDFQKATKKVNNTVIEFKSSFKQAQQNKTKKLSKENFKEEIDNLSQSIENCKKKLQKPNEQKRVQLQKLRKSAWRQIATPLVFGILALPLGSGLQYRNFLWRLAQRNWQYVTALRT